MHRRFLFVRTVAAMMTTWLCVRLMSDNNIGVEGAKALGPHLAKLNNMITLNLAGA